MKTRALTVLSLRLIALPPLSTEDPPVQIAEFVWVRGTEQYRTRRQLWLQYHPPARWWPAHSRACTCRTHAGYHQLISVIAPGQWYYRLIGTYLGTNKHNYSFRRSNYPFGWRLSYCRGATHNMKTSQDTFLRCRSKNILFHVIINFFHLWKLNFIRDLIYINKFIIV